MCALVRVHRRMGQSHFGEQTAIWPKKHRSLPGAKELLFIDIIQAIKWTIHNDQFFNGTDYSCR